MLAQLESVSHAQLVSTLYACCHILTLTPVYVGIPLPPYPVGPMCEPLEVPGGSYYVEDFIKYTVINCFLESCY